MIDLLIRLYPKAWRDRYGAEFRALLEDGGLGVHAVADVVAHAGLARSRPHRRGLIQLLALLVFAATEVVAVRTGYTENILWLPDGPVSFCLLAVVVGCAAFVLEPMARRVGTGVSRRTRRCSDD